MARQHVTGEQHHLPVRPDDGPLAVDNAEAVSVAIERETEIRPVLAHRRDQVPEIRRHARIGMVIGEVAVDVAVELDDVVAKRLEQPRRDISRDTVAAIDDDLPGLVAEGGRDLFADPPDVVLDHLRAPQTALPETALSRVEIVLLDPASEILDRIAVQRLAGDHDLQSVVLGRVVAAGDHDAAAGLEMLRREIEQRGRHPPDIDDVAAALPHPLDDCREQLGARMPSVAARDQRLHAAVVRLGADRAADPPDDLRGEGVADDAPDVVGAEN